SLSNHDSARYYVFALGYLGVFAASAVVAAYYQFFQDRLALFWRQQLTDRLVERYLGELAYYRINTQGEVAHPDQRITADVRSFSTTLLSFILIVFNSTLTIIAFAGILWSITPWLVVWGVVYAIVGCSMTFLLGHPLVGLDNRQLSMEAN